ncbi:hypothetical protein JOQ06_026137 [Pogonophryne albipinna]|uniref:HMG box domain-containing protein n=1 Tax=Pogonophryne albipinna TaxID=1090488 RepID=A0AAD6F5A4_9TELE|nr:hypothetical protein JOQ06_026137 [Pogonophryne albipinna]
MEQMSSRGEIGLNESPAVCYPSNTVSVKESALRGETYKLQSLPECVHPLVPLLLYSDRLLPPSPPYSGPIGAAASKQADAHSLVADTCYYINRQTVKKPLNAFMLFMKETRHKVLQEGRERESAAINRILGHRWHALSRSEQSKYYDLAQKERLLHMQLYPGWSARDNYGKRKRSQEPTGSRSRQNSK